MQGLKRTLMVGLSCGGLMACDPGMVTVFYTWAGGRPMYAPDVPATTTVHVQRRTDPRKPGPDVAPPVQRPFSQMDGVIPEIPYGSNLVIGRTIADIEEWPDRVAKVTAADVKKVAAKYLVLETSVTGFLIPQSAADEGTDKMRGEVRQ